MRPARSRIRQNSLCSSRSRIRLNSGPVVHRSQSSYELCYVIQKSRSGAPALERTARRLLPPHPFQELSAPAMKSDINPAVLAGSRPAQAMTSTSANEPPRDRRLYLKVMSTIRWLHIYLSMFGFTALVFFAITGITLNHSAWFGLEGEYVQDVTGKLDTKLLSPGGEESSVDKLMIVEALRKQHSLSGAVAEFRTDETECFVSFKGPGFAADAFITRESGEYQLSIARHGVVAIMNDLHKGRDSGRPGRCSSTRRRF